MAAVPRRRTGGPPAPGTPVEPAAGRFPGATIVCTVSYFGFRLNVTRRRGGSSWAMGQKWCRTSTSCTKSVKPVLLATDRFGTGFFWRGQLENFAGSAPRKVCRFAALISYRAGQRTAHRLECRRRDSPSDKTISWALLHSFLLRL
jgi:hypothetical protein